METILSKNDISESVESNIKKESMSDTKDNAISQEDRLIAAFMSQLEKYSPDETNDILKKLKEEIVARRNAQIKEREEELLNLKTSITELNDR